MLNLFTNCRTSTFTRTRVRAGISLDAEPLDAGGTRLQPVFIEASYERDDAESPHAPDTVTVYFVPVRGNGTTGIRNTTHTWPEDDDSMPGFARVFLDDNKPEGT